MRAFRLAETGPGREIMPKSKKQGKNERPDPAKLNQALSPDPETDFPETPFSNNAD